MTPDETKNTNKPILCLDFDGVIHRYDSGWQGATNINDRVTDGFFEWLDQATQHFQIVIYSSRSKEPGAIDAMRSWLKVEWYRHWAPDDPPELPEISYATEKPPAMVTIDDRAVTFTGSWGDFDPEKLLSFKPWNKV